VQFVRIVLGTLKAPDKVTKVFEDTDLLMPALACGRLITWEGFAHVELAAVVLVGIHVFPDKIVFIGHVPIVLAAVEAAC
jgi:hypothetical protein